jgi:hypothetical protein
MIESLSSSEYQSREQEHAPQSSDSDSRNYTMLMHSSISANEKRSSYNDIMDDLGASAVHAGQSSQVGEGMLPEDYALVTGRTVIGSRSILAGAGTRGGRRRGTRGSVGRADCLPDAREEMILQARSLSLPRVRSKLCACAVTHAQRMRTSK